MIMKIQNSSSIMDVSRASSTPFVFPTTNSSFLFRSPSISSGSSSSSSSSSTTDEPCNNEKFIPSLQAKLRKLILRSVSANITDVDPIVKTIYLGNVVTTWGKGVGCLERPSSALWKNHCEGRASIRMTVLVTPSGLKVETSEHGLTEYWNNRLTWCGIPNDSPKLFCWIYRHESRKLKQELRCHAVLCNSKDDARLLMESLRGRLAEALYDFRKEKLQKQNARLSSFYNVIYNTSPNSNNNQSSGNANSNNSSTTSTTSQNNYKKERPPPSKLSIIEESEEEEHFLLPELTSYDKVIHHLLQLELRRDNPKYYRNYQHASSSASTSATSMNKTNPAIHHNHQINTNHKASSLDSSDCGTKSNESSSASISPISSPPSSIIDGGNHCCTKDSRSNSIGSEQEEEEEEIFPENNIITNNNNNKNNINMNILSPKSKSSLQQQLATFGFNHSSENKSNNNNNSFCYEQIICSV